MAIVTGVVEAVSTKFDKYSIQVGGTWYSTKMEWAKVQPERGAEVSFDNGGGKFMKNVKIISGGSGGSAGGSAGPAKGGFSTLGVELGHAANLAMQVSLQGSPGSPGTPEFYKFFVEQTQTIFKVMKGLRKHYEEGEDTSSALEEQIEKVEKRPTPTSKKIEEDLF